MGANSPTSYYRKWRGARLRCLDVRLALLGYVVEWDKAGLPTAARSISGRAIVASSLIHRRFLRALEAVGRGEDPKAVIRDPRLNHSIRALANIEKSGSQHNIIVSPTGPGLASLPSVQVRKLTSATKISRGPRRW